MTAVKDNDNNIIIMDIISLSSVFYIKLEGNKM